MVPYEQSFVPPPMQYMPMYPYDMYPPPYQGAPFMQPMYGDPYYPQQQGYAPQNMGPGQNMGGRQQFRDNRYPGGQQQQQQRSNYSNPRCVAANVVCAHMCGLFVFIECRRSNNQRNQGNQGNSGNSSGQQQRPGGTQSEQQRQSGEERKSEAAAPSHVAEEEAGEYNFMAAPGEEPAAGGEAS